MPTPILCKLHMLSGLSIAFATGVSQGKSRQWIKVKDLRPDLFPNCAQPEDPKVVGRVCKRVTTPGRRNRCLCCGPETSSSLSNDQSSSLPKP